MEEDDCYYYSDEEEEEESAFDNEHGLESAVESQKAPSCKLITREYLMAAQNEHLSRVMDLLSVRQHHARTLLIHDMWDVDKLLSVFVEKGRGELFSRAGLSVNGYQDRSLLPDRPCAICLDEENGSRMTRMECGHVFCNDCWTQYFVVKITDSQSRRIPCMAYKCNVICDEDIIRDLVSKRSPELVDRFEQFLLESYIEDNRMVKWCPSTPHCGNAIQIKEDNEFCHEVECICGHQFCFSCLREPHSPCSCLIWERWAQKYQMEGGTIEWIQKHTKLCPNCHKSVEKNKGCNHMTCICKHQFCWLCGRDYVVCRSACGGYKSDYPEDHKKETLCRYTHHYTRFKAHEDSLRIETKQREVIKQKVSSSEEESNLRDFSWVTNGMDRLFRSRQLLSYSYAFAYHFFDKEMVGNEMSKEEMEMKKNLFEDQQQLLEANVEKLSMQIENPFNKYSEEQVLDTRKHVINLSVVVDSLCQKMYDCIENDLLGSLKLSSSHRIAPYRPNGTEKASLAAF